MNMSKSFSDLLQKAAQSDAFWISRVLSEFTRAVTEAMKSQQNMSRKDLAAKLGVRPSFITKVLAGDANLTFRTAVRLARAVNCSFHPVLGPASDWTLSCEKVPQQKTRRTLIELSKSSFHPYQEKTDKPPVDGDDNYTRAA